MSNQNKIYVVTVNLKLDEQRYFQAVQAFFKDKKTAKRFLKGSPFKGNIETVDPTDYTLEFLPASALGQVPAVLFKGSRFYAEMAEVKPHFEILMPDYHFEVKKFDETELFNKMMKVGGMYA